MKPLYDILKGLDSEPYEWTRDCQVAFDTFKKRLVLTSALGLPPNLLNYTFRKAKELNLEH